MGDYTIYCFAGVRLVAAEGIQAADDDQALASAARLYSGVLREVWQGDRFVGTIELDPDPDSIAEL